jgi:hypothetical protein
MMSEWITDRLPTKEDARWKPANGETYYAVHDWRCSDDYNVAAYIWRNRRIDNIWYDSYKCFKTREQAIQATRRIDNAIWNFERVNYDEYFERMQEYVDESLLNYHKELSHE